MTIEEIIQRLRGVQYICDEELAAAIFVAMALDRPLLVEGSAGVGKTEIAKAMSKVLGRRLIRLQCHVGIDETRAVYEWNYQKQLLAIQISAQSNSIASAQGANTDVVMQSIFTEDFLLERPLLQSISSSEPVVLLIDELDKADEEFESFLLELLAEYQVSIPELGTRYAVTRPFTVLTSNNARPLSDALRRRCAYAWLEYPSIEREVEIIQAKIPGVVEQLSLDVAEAVATLREKPRIIKKPSIAETLDWIMALEALGVERLDQQSAQETISAVLKNHADVREVLDDGFYKNLRARD
jgi:MoxR-like ATPase